MKRAHPDIESSPLSDIYCSSPERTPEKEEFSPEQWKHIVTNFLKLAEQEMNDKEILASIFVAEPPIRREYNTPLSASIRKISKLSSTRQCKEFVSQGGPASLVSLLFHPHGEVINMVARLLEEWFEFREELQDPLLEAGLVKQVQKFLSSPSMSNRFQAKLDWEFAYDAVSALQKSMVHSCPQAVREMMANGTMRYFTTHLGKAGILGTDRVSSIAVHYLSYFKELVNSQEELRPTLTVEDLQGLFDSLRLWRDREVKGYRQKGYIQSVFLAMSILARDSNCKKLMAETGWLKVIFEVADFKDPFFSEMSAMALGRALTGANLSQLNLSEMENWQQYYKTHIEGKFESKTNEEWSQHLVCVFAGLLRYFHPDSEQHKNMLQFFESRPNQLKAVDVRRQLVRTADSREFLKYNGLHVTSSSTGFLLDAFYSSEIVIGWLVAGKVAGKKKIVTKKEIVNSLTSRRDELDKTLKLEEDPYEFAVWNDEGAMQNEDLSDTITGPVEAREMIDHLNMLLGRLK